MKLLLALLFAVPLFGAASITLTNTAGTATNFPEQYGQPFVQGEIATCPQVIYDGTPLTSQADIKQRWPDGSVKHTVIAVLIPSVTAGSHTITYQAQVCSNTALTKTQMLAAGFNFNAQMLLTNGPTITADARTMLNAWDGTTQNGNITSPVNLWTSGQIAQTAIIALHGNSITCNAHPCSTYDIGFDANKSFRPIFHATFWPGTNQVHVRYIGENANTETIQNQTYSLALTAGNSSPATVYTKGSFAQTAATRWTKDFWIGGTPPSTITINPNLAYLALTKFLPNYNPAVTPAASFITAQCNAWTAAAKDIGDAGQWQKAMGSPGARPDIGPYESWVTGYLYSGDPCLRQSSLGNADLAASWPVHYREGVSTKILQRTDTPNSGTGLGLPVSISGRPTLCLSPLNYGSVPADMINAVGTTAGQGWSWDPSHEPEPGTILYAITGDYWYLEEAEFWESAFVALDYKGLVQRGPVGWEGILDHNQMRAEAWAIRSRANLAFVIPDALPMKSYIAQMLSDGICGEEGVRLLTTSPCNGTPPWTQGQAFSNYGLLYENALAFGNLGVTPLHQWSRGNGAFAQNNCPVAGGGFNDNYCICSTFGAGPSCSANTTAEAVSQFETDYMDFSLGRAKELGFASSTLLTWSASWTIGMLTDPGFNPFMADSGRAATVATAGSLYFPTFAAAKSGYQPFFQTRTSFQTNGDPDGYLAYLTAAMSYMSGELNGQTAWNFLLANGMTNASYANDPKWALIPRGAGAPCSIVPASLPAGTLNTSYSQSLSVNGCGAGPFTWSVIGSLPPGLTGCSGSSCTISGSPSTVTGSPFSFSVRVTGSGTATQSYSVAIAPGAITFDYNLTASGPTHVTQGRFMSFLVSSAVTVGADEGATPVVTGLPAGTTVTYINLIKFCCTSTTPGINGFLNPVQVNTTGTTPPGTYSLTITYTSLVSHVIRATTWPLVVDPPPSPIIPVTFPADVPLTGLATWQANMLSFGATYCNNMQGPAFEGFAWYYDGTRNYYQISDYTGDTATWLPCARLFDTAYRNYVLQTPPTWASNPGNIPGWHAFPLGLSMGFTRDAVAADKTAILAIQNNGYATVQNIAFVIGFLSSREMSYGLESNLVAESLGVARVPTFQQVAEILIGHFDQWFLTRNAQYVQPFMVALASEALIDYFNATGDLRVPPLLKQAADQLWSVSFDPLSTSMLYYNYNAAAGPPPPTPYPYDTQCSNRPSLTVTCQGPSPDLNLLIAPIFGWVYQQTGLQVYRDHGDILFNAGVSGAFLGAGKQFTQNYRWSADYVRWRNAPVAPPTGTCDLNHDFTTNVLDVQLVTNMGLNTVACTANINGLNTCNIVTVQRVINAALGGACQLGP